MKHGLIMSIKNSFLISLNKSENLWLLSSCFVGTEQSELFCCRTVCVAFFFKGLVYSAGIQHLWWIHSVYRVGFCVTFKTKSLKSSFIISDCVSFNHLQCTQTESKESFFDKGSLACISGDDRQRFELPIAIFTVCLSALSAIIECDSR